MSCCRHCTPGAARDLFADPAGQPEVGDRAAGAGDGRRCRSGADRRSRTRARRSTHSILGGGAKLQWKVDWAMRWVGARRRLRDVRQGSDRQRHDPVGGKIARALGRGASRRADLRDVPRREGREDFEVEGQRPKSIRAVAELWRPRKAWLSLPIREPGKAAKQLHIGVVPRAIDEYLPDPRHLSGSRNATRSSATPCTSMSRDGGMCRRPTAGDASGCCSTSSG